VLGRPGADRVYVNKLIQGPNTFDVIDTNGDGDPNVDLVDVERVEIRSFGGNDHIGVSGYGSSLGPFTLGPARVPLTLKAAGGNDELTGGSKADTALGAGGKDDLSGGASNDVLRGGPGNDDLDGDAGNDTCVGGPGSDTTVQCE
jgi:Ca2+-binding RTX toxin-like protein